MIRGSSSGLSNVATWCASPSFLGFFILFESNQGAWLDWLDCFFHYWRLFFVFNDIHLTTFSCFWVPCWMILQMILIHRQYNQWFSCDLILMMACNQWSYHFRCIKYELGKLILRYDFIIVEIQTVNDCLNVLLWREKAISPKEFKQRTRVNVVGGHILIYLDLSWSFYHRVIWIEAQSVEHSIKWKIISFHNRRHQLLEFMSKELHFLQDQNMNQRGYLRVRNEVAEGNCTRNRSHTHLLTKFLICPWQETVVKTMLINWKR